MRKTALNHVDSLTQAVRSGWSFFRPLQAAKLVPVASTKTASLDHNNLSLRSVVGHYLTINGDMLVDEFGVRIDGHIVGNVNAEHGVVMVGAGGSVTGTIRAARIIVAGKVGGNLIATDIIECRASAQVQGHVHSAGLLIHAGAIVRGTMAATHAKTSKVLAQAPANDNKHENVQQRAVG